MNIDPAFFELLSAGAARAAQDPVARANSELAATATISATGSIIRNNEQQKRSVYSDVEYILRTDRNEVK